MEKNQSTMELRQKQSTIQNWGIIQPITRQGGRLSERSKGS